MPKLELVYFIDKLSNPGFLVIEVVNSEHPEYIKGRRLEFLGIMKAMLNKCEISIKPLSKDIETDVNLLTKLELFED